MTIDIILPVYNAPDDLQVCVDSVRRHTPAGSYRLILIDDASPDDRIAAYFGLLSSQRDPHLLLLRNERNLGFVGTANRSMTLDSDNDVVLLNSDTIVTPGWLNHIARCAASTSRIGTITPFSNNAEICSFPAFCENTPLDALPDIELIAAAMAKAAVPVYPEIPTAVGFCMFIRRSLLKKIGFFDQETFGLGYGEENDFCMRAKKAGFRNVLCDDAFVAHTGGRSFDSKKRALMEANLQKLVARYPEYPQLIRSFIETDSLRPIREMARSRLRIEVDQDKPGILHILHARQGGTENHIRDLMRASHHYYRNYLLIIMGDKWRLEDGIDENVVAYEINRLEDEPWSDLLGALCGTFNIRLCHVHHVAGAREGLLHALAQLRIPYGLTLHDSYLACPTITLLGKDGEYCGAITEPVSCQHCLDAQALYKGISITAWREAHRHLIANAKFVLAPSAWLEETFLRYFPDTPIRVVPHGIDTTGLNGTIDTCSALLLPQDNHETVGVIGAIGPVKGARRFEQLVARTRQRRLPLRWVLVGYTDTQYQPHQDKGKCLTIHGAYKPQHLGALLTHYRIRLVVFPSAGPESFSYTLTEAWALGRPALVPPIGALGERVASTGAGWLMDNWQDPDQILDQIMTICAPENRDAFEERAERAHTMEQTSWQEMGTMTQSIYAEALSATHARIELVTTLDKPRLFSAIASGTVSSQAPGRRRRFADRILRRLGHYGLKIRYTAVGQWLYKTTPLSWQLAVKRRLLS